MNGNSRTLYFKSSSLPPSFKYCFRNLYCDKAIINQVIVPPIPLTDNSTTNNVDSAIKLVSSDKRAKASVTYNAFIGTPRLFNFPNSLCAIPSLDNEYRIRVQANRPVFPTDRMAVNMTKFIMSAAYGIPMISRTVTNGLSRTPACFHGTSADKTKIASI